jgi:dihydroorotate dehydrogenase subfamily 2
MGSKFNDKYLGTFGLASFFSMYFGHHLSTIEGGFINTNDEDLYYALVMMRSHGWARDLPEHKQTEFKEKYNLTHFDNLYNFYLPGMNLRSTDLQAHIGIRSIDKLDKYSITRNANFNYYVSNIKNTDLDIHISTRNFISNFAMPIVCKNKDTIDASADYILLLEKFYDHADYITINISSPNTKNLRDLQSDNLLNDFLQKISQCKNNLQKISHKNTPILLKIAPDLDLDQQKNIAKIVMDNAIDGVIISNTTIARNFNLKNSKSVESGGLSGKPLFEKSNEVLRNFYRLTEGKIPLIGVGGISCAQDAYTKIKNGASLIQIYSAFIYQGFSLVEKIKKQLSENLKKDGFKNISEAVGSSVK